jgi:hypothetical protein
MTTTTCRPPAITATDGLAALAVLVSEERQRTDRHGITDPEALGFLDGLAALLQRLAPAAAALDAADALAALDAATPADPVAQALEAAADALDAVRPWLVLLGHHIGNGILAPDRHGSGAPVGPMGRCEAIAQADAARELLAEALAARA